MTKFKAIISLCIPIAFALATSIILQNWILKDQAQFIQWLASYGKLVILVYIPLQALTLIIAPLGGLFLMVGMIALFGPGLSITLLYLISVPCYTFNFLLAKKYGRPLVEKIIGHESLAKFDHYVNDTGLVTLVVLRLFLGGSFDYLSYGYGLTQVRLRDFFMVNVLVGAAATYLFYLIFKYSSSINTAIIVAYIIGFIFAGTALVINHFFRKHKI